jgi:hypothetical protein
MPGRSSAGPLENGRSNGWSFNTPPSLPSPHGWGRVRVGGICIDVFYPVDRWNEYEGVLRKKGSVIRLQESGNAAV